MSHTTSDVVVERTAVPRVAALKKDENTLSPSIFAKKIPMVKREPMGSRRLVVFENILSVVAQAYFKKSYEIETTVKELKLELDGDDVSESSKTQGRRSIRNKRRRIRLSLVTGTGRKTPMVEEDDKRDEFFGHETLLDHLVSPLKEDFPFGALTRDLESEGDRRIRDEYVRLRQAVRQHRGDGGLISSTASRWATWCSFITCGSSLRTTAFGKSTRTR